MNIVFVDADSIGEDIDLSGFNKLGDVTRYGYISEEEMPLKCKDADVIITNKNEINEKTTGNLEHLKLVCVTATGTNMLDKDYLARRNIEWRNVANYSTDSVAQHTFALLFFLLEKLSYYDNYVKSEKYVNDVLFTHFTNVYHNLSGMTWGIIGLGNIGRKVTEIARTFGCYVIYYSTSHAAPQEGYEQVSFDELLQRSDIVSVHAPLNSQTENLMNKEAFEKMKKSAIFINVGRGQIVNEEDLAWALESGEIKAAGLDVLSKEPMTKDNPLRKIKDSEKLFITPHIAWASLESRQRLMKIIEGQVKEFKEANNI